VKYYGTMSSKGNAGLTEKYNRMKKPSSIRQSSRYKLLNNGHIMMKTICCLLFAVTMFFLVSQANAAEWVSIGESTLDTEWFYDRETLTEPSRDIMKVWTKQVFFDEGRKKNIQTRISDKLPVDRYDLLSHSLLSWEINCSRRERRLTTLGKYFPDGVILASYTIKLQPSEGWSPLTPGSIGEAMYKTVCLSTPKKMK
jgi:hypothetical protein